MLTVAAGLRRRVLDWVAVDRVQPDVRSLIMRTIRSRNTSPELLVRSVAHCLGLRFRLCVRALPGSPDIVLPRHKTVIFVHGCFWHSHGCRPDNVPKTRTEYWEAKFAATRARDACAIAQLTASGWRVLRVWECQTKNIEALRDGLRRAFSLSSAAEDKYAALRGKRMTLDEIKPSTAAEQRVERLRDNAKSAKDRAKQLKTQADAGAEENQLRQSRAKLAQTKKADMTSMIKPYR